MQIQILEKHRADDFEEFSLKVNKKIDRLNKHFHVFHVKIQPYKDNLICLLIYKPLI
jgi:hypothetical protein